MSAEKVANLRHIGKLAADALYISVQSASLSDSLLAEQRRMAVEYDAGAIADLLERNAERYKPTGDRKYAMKTAEYDDLMRQIGDMLADAAWLRGLVADQ